MEALNNLFIDAEEKETAVLGEGYLVGFHPNKKLRNGVCVLTDKRFYCKGRYFQKVGKVYQQKSGEYTINLNDITGSGFSTARFSAFLLLEILLVIMLSLLTGLFLLFAEAVGHYYFRMDDITCNCLILVLLGLVAALVYYYLKPFRIFVIEYVNGTIAFLAFDYPEDDLRMFQRELHKAKDACSPMNS